MQRAWPTWAKRQERNRHQAHAAQTGATKENVELECDHNSWRTGKSAGTEGSRAAEKKAREREKERAGTREKTDVVEVGVGG